MQTLQETIVAWADSVHPNRTPEGTLLKLFEEIGEIASEPSNPDEYADVMIVLLDLAHQHGISADDLIQSTSHKMAVNSARNWHINSMGVMRHE